MTNIVNQKKQIRKLFLQKRKNLSSDEIAIKSAQITNNFINNLLPTISYNKNSFFALYFDYLNEVKTSLIADYFIENNFNFCYPKITSKNDMAFNIYDKNCEISYNSIFKNIAEIAKSQIVEPEILILPLISFDSSKMRLGMGGGFYDRYILSQEQKNKNVTKIGLAYDFQEYSDYLPQEKHDKKLDFIVTNNKIFS